MSAFNLGAITGALGLDASGYASAINSSIASAQTFASKTTAVLKQATDKQKQILDSVRGQFGRSVFDDSALSSMRNFYARQAAEAQKLRQVNRTAEEQAIRDTMAFQIKAMRQQSFTGRVGEEVQRRLFGDGGSTKAALRQVNRTFEEQSVRDSMAARIKAMRSEALSSRVGDEVNRRLFGGASPAAVVVPVQPKLVGKEGFLDSVKSIFGRGSFAKESMELLAGGGVIMGLGLAATAVNDLTKKAEAFALAMQQGPEAASEMAAELLKSIPVAGQLGDAMSRVWGLISGETLEMAKLKESIEQQDMLTDAMATHLRIAKEQTQATAEYVEQIERSINRLGLAGTPLKLFDIGADALDRQKEIIKQAEDAKTNDPGLQKAKADLAKLETKINATPRSVLDLDTSKSSPFSPGRLVEISNPALATLEAEAKRIKKEIADSEAAIDKSKDQKSFSSAKMEWAQRAQIALEGVQKWLEPIRHGMKERQELFKDQFTGLRDQVMQIGMSDAQKVVYELKNAGIVGDQLKEAQKWADLLDKKTAALNKSKEAESQLKVWREKAETPEEKMRKDVQFFQEQLISGSIKSVEEYQKLIAAAKDEFVKSSLELDKASPKAQEPKLAGLMRFGSAESQRYRYELGSSSSSAKDPAEKQLAEQQKANEILERMDRRLKDANAADAVVSIPGGLA